jgi:hypothetical protein
MKWIFAGFLIATGIYLIRGNTSRHIAIRRLIFTGFILVGISIILFADFWTKLSKSLGVGSSTQLLTYLVTFGFISSTISNYRWRREQELRLVELARTIALKDD